MAFLEKYYKPWTLLWIIQQGLRVTREGRLFKVSFKTLWVDFLSSRKVDKKMKNKSTRYSDIEENGNYTRLITCKGISPGELSSLNHYFDQVYVINLARRKDRRDEMIRKLTGLKVKAEFFPAEDGQSEENMREFREYYNTPIDPHNAHEMEIRLKRKVMVSPGAWGILKTYRNLISEAQARGFDRILCLEDDVVFAKDFEEMFTRAIKLIPGNWKVLYLGASQHSWEENIDLITPQGALNDNDNLHYYYPLNTDGAFALGLHSSIFSYLLSESDSMNCPLDTGALRSASKKFTGECFVLQPNLVIADVRESDIRVNRKQKDFAEIARWDLSLYDIKE